MQSHELLREVFHDGSAKQVAADLGLSLSMVYKWAEPRETDTGSGSTNPLDRVEALIDSTKDARIAQWVCQRAGGFFIKNPKAQWPHPYQVIPATNQIVQEFADMLGVIAEAAGDNHINKAEAKAIRARWEELKSVTEGFVRCCEEGNFNPISAQSANQAKSAVPDRTRV
jgi:transposase